MAAALQLPSLLDEKQDWTVDDLASLPQDLRYELIDGRLILPSPTGLHQLFGVEIVCMLRPNCPPGFTPLPDLSMKVNQRNEPRPDVVVLRNDLVTRSPAPIEGAILVVEVISPDSHLRDLHTKAKIYAGAGVGNYWVIDPMSDDGVLLTEFRIGDAGEYEIVTDTNKVFVADVPYPVVIDLPALTGLRNRYIGGGSGKAGEDQ